MLHNMQVKRKQYYIQNYIAITINVSMGDTLTSVAITLSMDDNNYSMWDK